MKGFFGNAFMTLDVYLGDISPALMEMRANERRHVLQQLAHCKPS